MPFFDPTPKPRGPKQRTPNWGQVTLLLVWGFVAALGGCGGAFVVFSTAYGSTAKWLFLVFWTLMLVCAAGVLMVLVGIAFVLAIAVRALFRKRRPSGGNVTY